VKFLFYENLKYGFAISGVNHDRKRKLSSIRIKSFSSKKKPE